MWGTVFRKFRLLQTILIIVFASAALLLASQGSLFAFTNPHAGNSYPIDTDICAKCHRAHTGVAEHLTVPFAQSEQCFTCHDGTGSSYNIETKFTTTNHHGLNGLDVGAGMECASCHESHLPDPNSWRMLINPKNTRNSWPIVDETHSTYNNATPPSGIYLWCESCHIDSAQAQIGTVIHAAETTQTAYIPYTVQISALTPYSQVDNNGDTNTATYWRYFTINTIADRYGYNDDAAIGQSAHGRAGLSAAAQASIGTWKGQYGANYPALPCTRCHDHHGSNQPWMIVDTITVGAVETSGYDMTQAAGQKTFCETCHIGSYTQCDLNQKCTNCHRHGKQF